MSDSPVLPGDPMPAPPPRKAGVSYLLVAFVSLLMGASAAWLVGRSGGHAGQPAAEKPAARYHCAMHPTYTSDHPGDCPICGMKLVPMEATAPASPAAASGERRIAFYRSPMDPTVRSDKPAKDSMGMDFIPVYEDEANAPPPVAGRVPIQLSPERRQFLGVKTEQVRSVSLEKRIRTVGRVAVDERRVHHIHTKYEGYVEHLYVDYTGKLVRAGEPLLSLYSPELVATQQEYLLALRAQREMRDSGIPSASQGGADLLEAARRRLLLWDIREADIARLAESGNVTRTLDLYAESGGYVAQKNVVHGMRVMPSDTLFDIADLSSLWVLADVYESDLSSIRMGMAAEVVVPFLPGRTWRGSVTYIAPTVEEKTRTIKVRVEVQNRDGALKPDMFTDVFLSGGLGTGIAVPGSALIQAGDRSVVFLDRGEGRFVPREVVLGTQIDGSYQVLSGIAEGDRVVTSANFLIDSESSLRAALSAMTPEAKPASAHQH